MLTTCKLVDGKDFTKLPIFKLFSIFRVNHRYKINVLHLLLKLLFFSSSCLFSEQNQITLTEVGQYSYKQQPCSVSGWMMVRTWVEWIPALSRDHWLLRARGQLAAAPRAEHFRAFPVEMPLAQMPSRVKEQERNRIAEHRPDCFTSLYC